MPNSNGTRKKQDTASSSSPRAKFTFSSSSGEESSKQALVQSASPSRGHGRVSNPLAPLVDMTTGDDMLNGMAAERKVLFPPKVTKIIGKNEEHDEEQVEERLQAGLSEAGTVIISRDLSQVCITAWSKFVLAVETTLHLVRVETYVEKATKTLVLEKCFTL